MYIKDFEINYRGKKCSLYDCFKYKKSPKDCPDLEKVSVIVYFGAELDKIEISKQEFNIDSLMSMFVSYYENYFFFLLKIIEKLKLKEIPSYLQDFFETKDEDTQYEILYKFLKENLPE